jgi:SAM-dependent methyltransferase
MSERQAPLPPEKAPAAMASGSGSDAAIDVSIEDVEPETPRATIEKVPEAAPSSSRDLSTRDAEASSQRGADVATKLGDHRAGEITAKLGEHRAGEVTAKLGEHRPGEITARRTRPKVTLKIPDDEVARPQATPSSPPVKAELPLPDGPPMTPMRIISIDTPLAALKKSVPPPVQPPRPSAAPPPAPKPPPPSPDDSWTPYQPPVADRTATGGVRSADTAAAVERAARSLDLGVGADRAVRSPDVAAPPAVERAARGPEILVPPAAPPVGAPLPRVASIPPTPQVPLAPPRPSYHSAPPMPAAAVVPPPPATSPMPLAPPTVPRKADSMDDIPIVTEEESPPSSGEIEIDDDARPTRPLVSTALEPKLVAPPPPPPPPPAVAPSLPAPSLAPRVEVVSVHTAITPMAQPVAPAVPLAPAPSPPAPVVAPAPAALITPAAAAVDRPALAAEAPAPPPLPPPIAPIPLQVVTVPALSPPVDVDIKDLIKDLPPMRAQAPTEPEALEVHFEDEEPPDSSPRTSEPEAEIAPEDLVSIESAPSPSKLPVAAQLQTETPGRAFLPLAPPAPITASSAPTPPQPARGSFPPPPAASAKPAVSPKLPPRVIVPTASALAPPPMSESAPGRRKARPWWEELFNDDFIRTMAKISDEQIAKEVDFVEESLAVAKGAMLLDLACGTGRHAIELTRRGYKVVGFDLSLPMLAKAAEEAQERNQKLNFVQGDMREMTFEDTFDGIYCWNTSFGFFEEDKNIQVIQRVHKALKKGGQFMLEVGNRDFIIRQAPSLAWFEGDGCICMDEMSIDWITSRMKVKRTMMMDDGRTKEIDYSVRIYSLHELGKVLHDAGFRVAEVSGRTGTPGVYFGSESPRTMILAEKK